jgi:hypothetical protein
MKYFHYPLLGSILVKIYVDGRSLIREIKHKHSFYVRKLRAQLFCASVLGLYLTGARLLAQKLRVECW